MRYFPFMLFFVSLSGFAQAPKFTPVVFEESIFQRSVADSVTVNDLAALSRMQLIEETPQFDLLPSRYKWRKEINGTQIARRAGFGFNGIDCQGRQMPLDVMKEVTFGALYSTLPQD